MELRPREIVILAEDYETLVAWYRDVLGFKVVQEFTEGYRYCNLETESGIRIGIAPAQDVDVKPSNRASNTTLLQVEVDDVKALFEHLQDSGSTVTFGPTFDESGSFWFGGFEDLEGNPIWVVDSNCP